jgi:hypothetical protein
LRKSSQETRDTAPNRIKKKKFHIKTLKKEEPFFPEELSAYVGTKTFLTTTP